MVGSSSGANAVVADTRARIDKAEFLFPDEIPIDASHTLDQHTTRFRSVRDGAPELIKNSKDQYERLGVLDRGLRQIVVIADPKRLAQACEACDQLIGLPAFPDLPPVVRAETLHARATAVGLLGAEQRGKAGTGSSPTVNRS